jgi:hypothetical protein
MGGKDTKDGWQLALLTPSASAIVKIDMHRGSATREDSQIAFINEHVLAQSHEDCSFCPRGSGASRSAEIGACPGARGWRRAGVVVGVVPSCESSDVGHCESTVFGGMPANPSPPRSVRRSHLPSMGEGEQTSSQKGRRYPSFQPRGWNTGLTKSVHVPRVTRGHPAPRRAKCPPSSVCSKSVQNLSLPRQPIP